MALVVGVCFEGGLFLPLFGDRGALVCEIVRKEWISPEIEKTALISARSQILFGD